MMEMTFRRPANPRVEDRLRLHGHKDAFEKYGELLARNTGANLPGLSGLADPLTYLNRPDW